MKKIWICIVVVISLVAAFEVAYAAPVVSDVYPVNVTTRSFTVIWQASEPATADMVVYGNALGTGTVGVVTSHPVLCGNTLLASTAQNLGVMSAQVTGLSANTTYYYRTVTTAKADASVTNFPAFGDPLLEVTTETKTVRATAAGVPFSNDVMIQNFTRADGTTPADGTIVFASASGSDYGLAAIVGDCVASGAVLLDLNNIFDRATGESMDISQGAGLNLVNFRGTDGVTQIVHEVPADNNLAEIHPPDPGLQAGWNMVSMQVEPADTAAVTVLGPLASLLTAWEYNNGLWDTYDPTFPPFFNTLQNLHTLHGYWFELNAPEVFSVTGDTTENGPVLLSAGWNMIGSPGIENIGARTFISRLSGPGGVISIWHWDASLSQWVTFDPLFPDIFNTLQEIEPGKAYWFEMDPACGTNQCQI